MPKGTHAMVSALPGAYNRRQENRMFLSEAQRRFFDVFGYLPFPGLLSDRIGAMIREFEAIWTAQGGGHCGKAHDGKDRSCIVPFLDQSADLCTLLDDPRIVGIATSLLGD